MSETPPSADRPPTLDLGEGKTWLTPQQEMARELVASLQVLTNPTSSERHEVAAANTVRRLFASLLESQRDGERLERVQNEGISVVFNNGQFEAFERGSSIRYAEPDVRFAIDSIPASREDRG
jgi:hypothetical protein